jgi:hypothetical protein
MKAGEDANRLKRSDGSGKGIDRSVVAPSP